MARSANSDKVFASLIGLNVHVHVVNEVIEINSIICNFSNSVRVQNDVTIPNVLIANHKCI